MAIRFSLAVVFATLAEASLANRIGNEFVDSRYRIERQFVPASTTSALLKDLVYKGIPREDEEGFPTMAVQALGDAGNKKGVREYQVAEYGSALQNFTQAEYHKTNSNDPKHSLVYRVEQMVGPSLQRSEEILTAVISPSFLEAGGSSHLYMSSPGYAALDNHTDVTDIVVLQLDGAKEWLLCTEKKEEEEDVLFAPLRATTASPFSRKLNACSKYERTEMDTMLDCQRTILHPGDVLFLPRRVVHSARALSTTYSAHLTFGYKKMISDATCVAYHQESHRHLDCDFSSCDENCHSGCDASCDKYWVYSCDNSCDETCYSGCDGRVCD